jgi:nitrogen fixation protein FixH
MKQVTVKSVSGQTQVNLNNASNGDALNARMAKAARDIAFGVGANATVTDGQGTYRVTRSGVRKQEQEW